MTWKVTPDVERFDDAVDWFQKRTVLTSDQARDLDARTRHEAFWIGGGLQLEQIQSVFDKLNGALARGDTFEDFRKAVRGQLSSPAHTETVFRNAAQRSYNAGRYLQMMEPSVRRFRPYGMVDAILDGRTTVYCRTLNGTVVALDSPWWDTHWFPAHHRCRTGVRNMRVAEAEKRGIADEPPAIDPPSGWGQAPTAQVRPWKPDPKTHDSELTKELGKKEAAAPARKPADATEHDPETWTKHYAEQYGDAAESVGWGRAALERGLDMPVSTVRAHLDGLADVPGVKMLSASIDGLPDTATLRGSGAEIEPLRRAAAALGGHIEGVPERPALTKRSLEQHAAGRRALSFFSKVTGPEVRHPEDWSFRKIAGRASCSQSVKRITWTERAGVLEHEWGHALEFLNPSLLKRATAFLQARTRGERLQYLRDLKRNPGYGAGEVARPDGFIDSYIGKHYDGPAGIFATEVTSMGVELLVAGQTTWGKLELLLKHDPEHFFFLLGQLKGP